MKKSPRWAETKNTLKVFFFCFVKTQFRCFYQNGQICDMLLLCGVVFSFRCTRGNAGAEHGIRFLNSGKDDDNEMHNQTGLG